MLGTALPKFQLLLFTVCVALAVRSASQNLPLPMYSPTLPTAIGNLSNAVAGVDARLASSPRALNAIGNLPTAKLPRTTCSEDKGNLQCQIEKPDLPDASDRKLLV